jgi:hypothetical protein
VGRAPLPPLSPRVRTFPLCQACIKRMVLRDPPPAPQGQHDLSPQSFQVFLGWGRKSLVTQSPPILFGLRRADVPGDEGVGRVITPNDLEG